jgi:hypothetical protein
MRLRAASSRLRMKNDKLDKTRCASPKWAKTHLETTVSNQSYLFTLSSMSDDAAVRFKTALLSRFACTDDGLIKRYVGLDISRDANHIHLSQEPLAEARSLASQTLQYARLQSVHDSHGGWHSHARQGQSHHARPCSLPKIPRMCQHSSVPGYLESWTRPDLQLCTNELSKHLSNPGTTHWNAATHVLRYLKGTSSLGLTYTCNLPNSSRLEAYAHAHAQEQLNKLYFYKDVDHTRREAAKNPKYWMYGLLGRGEYQRDDERRRDEESHYYDSD